MLYLVYDKKQPKIVEIKRSEPGKSYSSPDVPHGRWSVLYLAFKAMNDNPKWPDKVTLPEWTSEELASIRQGVTTRVEEENPLVPVTEEEVLDRYYKHDPETGERTDEPTGEFESIEACRAAMEQEREEQHSALIAELVESEYKKTMDECLVAPLAMEQFDAQMSKDKRFRIIHLDHIEKWPMSEDELDAAEKAFEEAFK